MSRGLMTAKPQRLVEHALETTTSEQCVVIVHDTTSANLRWANNTLTTNGVMHEIDVTVVAFHGAGNASVSGTAASLEQVTALVERADRAAVLADPAEDRAELVTADAAGDWHDEPGETSIRVFEQYAAQLGEAFARADAESRLLYGFVFHEVSTTYLGTSTGLRLRHVQPTGHYGCTGKNTALTNSAWVGGATRDFTDVDADRMATDLATRLSWGERRIDLPAGRYDTVLPPSAVADLMIDAYWTAGARTADDGQSVFSRPGGGTRIGEQVVREGVHLYSDPAYPGIECAPFVVDGASSDRSSVYDNGLPLGRTAWIDDGRLTALMQTRHTAQLTGQPTTPAIDNVVLEVDGGTGTDLDLAAGMDDGLLLTCLWYIREVDPQTMLLTGLTRDGVYRVEGGEITGAVNNFRYNESPLDLLRRYTHVGETVPSFSREWGEDFFSRTATPALRIPDFNMSSVSQAL
jgi:predicted Zn-dependent protease